jgi:hypothetical protein
MGKSQRDKGYRGERKVIDALAKLGIPAKRVPLSGAVEGFKGDVKTATKILEVKWRGDGFKTLRKWLSDHNGVVLLSDFEEPLLVIRLADAKTWFETGGDGA